MYQYLLKANIQALEAECLKVLYERQQKEFSRTAKNLNKEHFKFMDDTIDVKIPRFECVAADIVADVVIKLLADKGFKAYNALGDILVIHLGD